MERAKTEIILHTMDGSTSTFKTELSKSELNQCFFGTNGFNSLIGFTCDNNSSAVVNMNNVCFVVLNDLGDENGDEGSN